MSYGLGVDLGTTFTAAAIARDGRVEMASLGDHTDAVPSVVLIRSDGAVLTGDAAERRAAADPDRVAREVKRRLGDPTPLILGGAPHPATELIAHQLRAVMAAVSARQGGDPDTVTLAHPANWGPYKRELFGQVPGLAGLVDVGMVTEPEAAAAHYARNNHLPEDALVAVYDLGGGTFDATVLRIAGHGFEILGRPEGIEGVGGIDFDEAVFRHVDRTLDGAVSRLDLADVRATSATVRLRRDCVIAKEALSADTETTIPVLLPQLQTQVRLTRGEFEDMIRPPIETTIASLRRALDAVPVDPSELTTVLLVGGSSRIPLVAQMVSAELARPTAVDAHPKHATALGAAARFQTAAIRSGTPTARPAAATVAAARDTATTGTDPALSPSPVDAGPTPPAGPTRSDTDLTVHPPASAAPAPGAPAPGTPAPALGANGGLRRRSTIGPWWVASQSARGSEQLLQGWVATRTRGHRAVVGMLFLTDQRLLFSPNVVESLIGSPPWAVALDKIAVLGVVDRTGHPFNGGWRARLRVELHDGDKELFEVGQVHQVLDTVLAQFPPGPADR